MEFLAWAANEHFKLPIMGSLLTFFDSTEVILVYRQTFPY
jgi:hypothetical protein